MERLGLTSPYFQEYVISRLRNQEKIGEYDASYLNKILSIVPKGEDEFLILLLLQKSAFLREQGKIKESLAVGLYAVFLSSIHQVHKETSIRVNTLVAFNYWRERDWDIGTRYIDQALLFCSTSSIPYCKKVLISALSVNREVGLQKDSLMQVLLSDTLYAPSIDRFIRTTIGWSTEDQEKKRRFFKENIEINHPGFCHLQLYNIDYLVNSYISTSELDSALYCHNLYKGKCNGSNPVNDYLVHRQKHRIDLARYELTNNAQYLQSAIQGALDSRHLATHKFTHDQSLHYADFLQDNLIEILDIFMHSKRAGNKMDLDSIIFDVLQQSSTGKIDRVYNHNRLYNSIIDPVQLRTLKKLQLQLDALELQCKEYKDTLLQNTAIYEDIYNLYERINAIKSELPTLPKSEVEPFDLGYYQAYLDENDIQVFNFNAGYDHYYLSYLDGDQLLVDTIDKYHVDSLVESLNTQIRKRAYIGEISGLSQKIYEELMEPYLDTSIENIIIIPDDKLSALPFEALQAGNEGNTYLVDQFNLSYDYQFSISNKTYQISNSSIALFSFSDEQTIRSKAKRSVSELPVGYQEVNHINTLYEHGFRLDGKALQKEKLLSVINNEILHFSTHSFSNPHNYLDNYILVRDKTGKTEKMYGFEFSQLPISADLVVLSSCNSGTGSNKFGAGTFSLSRDFLKAGAQNVIKSLWAVNESSTAELMYYLHENIANCNASYSQSLTKAKRKLKSIPEYQHPYYWSGFVLEGNAQI